MSFVPTPGAVRVDIQYVMSGQQVHNIIWCSRDAAWTSTEREALASAISTWWTAQKSNFTSSMALSQITVVNQEANNSPSSTLIISPPEAGTGAGIPPSNGTALVATLRTDLRGRNYRGRMYIAGARTADMQDSLQTTTAHVAALLAALAALKTAIEGLGALWVVVSTWVNKVRRANGLKTPITAISMDTYWDSQRRRLAGRGV